MPHASPLADSLHARLADAAESFLRNDPGSTGVCDPDPVHDSRVALRRSRSYLRTFAALFDRGLAPSIRVDLKWYAAYLGGARDVDVVATILTELGARLDTEAELGPVLACVEDARTEAIERLVEASTLDRYGRVVAHMERLRDVAIARARAADTARFVARPWRDFQNAVHELERSGDAERLHEVRIRSKELRYAGEVTAGVEERLSSALSTAAQGVQERIGSHRDGLAVAAFLERRADELGPNAFIAGMLALLARQQAAEVLVGLEDDLRRVRRRYRNLRRALR